MTTPHRKKMILAALSGLILTAAFPPLGLEWLAWFALFPLLKGLEDVPPSRAFLLGLVAGLFHFLTLIYWIVPTLQNYGYLGLPLSVAALLLLCLYLALYPAVFASLFSYLRGARLPAFTAGGLWVGLELIRAHFLTGFPWCLLGYTQFERLSLIQVADMTGVYGISFLVVLSNVLIHRLVSDRHGWRKGSVVGETAGALVLIALSLAYGNYRLAEEVRQDGERKSIQVALIQGNIDQSIKWNPAYQERTIETYRRLTRVASSLSPELVVWPETAMPFFFPDNPYLSPRVFEISKESEADLIFGSPAFRRTRNGTRYYNRVYLIRRGGALSGYYDKVHLVPFGEYVPFRWLFPFFEGLLHASGNFASGNKIEPLRLTRRRAGILICFEVIFPELARIQSKKGAEVLINLTNDAWFGRTSAPYQHLSMAVFRAVENGRPLIRSANTGFSAFIGPHGRIEARSALFKEEVLGRGVTVPEPSLRFYTRYGDLFAMALLMISLLRVLYVLWYNKVVLSGFSKRP